MENGPSTGLSSSRKSKSIDRIPRLPDRKDGTARARATWRVPNRRQSELLRSSHHHHHENKSPRTRSDGEVDVRDVTLLFQLRSLHMHACNLLNIFRFHPSKKHIISRDTLLW